MKTKVLVEVRLNCDPPSYIYRWNRTVEQQAKELESWVKDFHDFIRYHRSQDPVDLSVERIYEQQCSYCKNEWETDVNGMPECCNKAQEEFESETKKAPPGVVPNEA